jgi:hypothetical protein
MESPKRTRDVSSRTWVQYMQRNTYEIDDACIEQQDYVCEGQGDHVMFKGAECIVCE